MSRRLAQLGQSYQDANPQLVGVEKDVLDIKRRIEERYPSLELFYDEVDEQFIIVEHCKDGRDRLCLVADELDERIMDRIHVADQTQPDHVDIEERVDTHNESIKRENNRRFGDTIGDFGQRLTHALKKDGFMRHEDISGTTGPKRSAEAIRVQRLGSSQRVD